MPRARKAEIQYAARLKSLAYQVGRIINQFPAGDPSAAPSISELLERYAVALDGWAVRTATRMLQDVERRDRQTWQELAAEMSQRLRHEIATAPTGQVMRSLLDEQVALIKSIPLDAAKRVHELTLKGLEDSTRSSEIAREIMRSGEVAASRAKLIARTEVSRTATTLTEARALHVGSPGYFWRTSGDLDVRHDHEILDGEFIPWNKPPIADRRTGVRAHAGCIYGCRCYPGVALPE